ncbi:MAG: two-component regulator propeller domain-containing protein [Brevundimonas sp.]
MFGARNGDLWIWRRRDQSFWIYQSGQLRPVGGFKSDGIVAYFAQTADGAIWAGLPQPGKPLYRHHQGRWSRIDQPPPQQASGHALIGMAATPDGALWLSYVHHVMRIPAGSVRPEQVLSTPDAMGVVQVDGQGRVWLIERNGVRRISEAGGRPPFTLGPATPLPTEARPRKVLIDRTGDLWMATWTSGVSRTSLAGEQPTVEPKLEVFTRVEGLSSNVGSAVLEDREGNIWVGTSAGLDRFRPAAITLEAQLMRPAIYGDVLTTGADGSVYIAQSDALYRVRPQGRPERLTTMSSEPRSLCEGPDGTIWVGTADQLISLSSRGRRDLPLPESAKGSTYDCLFDRTGEFLLTAGSAGVYRRRGGDWMRETLAPGGPAVLATVLERDATGDVWASGGDNLYRLSGGRWQAINKLPSDWVNYTLHQTTRGLLLVGRHGLGLYASGQAALLSSANAFRGATGVVQTLGGETWVLNGNGLLRLPPGELEAMQQEKRPPRFRVFEAADGLPERYPNQSVRSLVRGGDGRIWLATLAGTAWIDPQKIPNNRLPPPVTVTALTAGGALLRDPKSVRLAAGVADIAVSFAALSLAIPERVQVRYRLEGHDRDWVDPGQRRQAFYTNLQPGTYRFRVIAANEDGVWNQEGATLQILIPPTFVQSIWFKLLIALALLGLAWTAYVLRVRYLTEEIRARFQVRVAERERIARELHDTLLQGFHGLMLRFQAVAGEFPAGGALRQSVEEALDRADEVLVEGRARVRELRTHPAGYDLPEALAAAIRTAEEEGAGITLVVQGAVRPLRPLVQDELFRIAQEAIRNAVQHARTDRVEVVLDYSRRDVRLAVRDDGVGLPPDLLTAGRDGHYGLVGMRERAERIGGRLAISGREPAGTEILVIVPRHAAYVNQRPSWLKRPWRTTPPTS